MLFLMTSRASRHCSFRHKEGGLKEVSEQEELLRLAEKLAELRCEAEEVKGLGRDLVAMRQFRRMLIETAFD